MKFENIWLMCYTSPQTAARNLFCSEVLLSWSCKSICSSSHLKISSSKNATMSLNAEKQRKVKINQTSCDHPCSFWIKKWQWKLITLFLRAGIWLGYLFSNRHLRKSILNSQTIVFDDLFEKSCTFPFSFCPIIVP